MFDLGTQELIIIFIVAFLVFGPKKLPELGRTLGKGIRELKSAMRGVKESFEEAESDITDEVNKTKDDLKESVYKSIESNLTREEEKKEEEKKEEEAKQDTGEAEKETDRDG